MKKALIALVLGLMLGIYSHANAAESVVHCSNLRFDDIASLDIVKAASSQYVVIENHSDRSVVTSAPFSEKDLRSGEIAALSEWNGYSRTLIRDGKDNWSVRYADECNSSTMIVDCTDSL